MPYIDREETRLGRNVALHRQGGDSSEKKVQVIRHNYIGQYSMMLSPESCEEIIDDIKSI